MDGTLAHYDEWASDTHIGEPVPLMVSRVKEWRQAGIEVRVFTARIGETKDDRNPEVVRQHIAAWCLRHIGEVLPVTNLKDFGMIELWDDRAVCVEKNTGRIL